MFKVQSETQIRLSNCFGWYEIWWSVLKNTSWLFLWRLFKITEFYRNIESFGRYLYELSIMFSDMLKSLSSWNLYNLYTDVKLNKISTSHLSLINRIVSPIIKLTLYLLKSQNVNIWRKFGHRSGPTRRRIWSSSKLFETLMVFLKEFFEKVGFEKNQHTTKTCKIIQHANK